MIVALTVVKPAVDAAVVAMAAKANKAGLNHDVNQRSASMHRADAVSKQVPSSLSARLPSAYMLLQLCNWCCKAKRRRQQESWQKCVHAEACRKHSHTPVLLVPDEDTLVATE